MAFTVHVLHFFYSDDDGVLVGFRDGNIKYVYQEQRLAGTMGVWAEPFTTLRLQKIFNLYRTRMKEQISLPILTGTGI